MKIIDGENAVMGRLASFAAKEALKGEEIVIVNCNKVLISGSRKRVESDFQIKRGRYGSSQKGPRISKSNEQIVKRTIRGMLPNFREGRGKELIKKIKCYNKVPKEYENSEKVKLEQKKLKKSIKLEEMRK
jgi:large subunit ribosomal protein L13